MRILKTIALAAALAVSAIALDAYKLNGPKWAASQVPYFVNPANADVSASAALAAVQKGAAAWSQSQAHFSFYYMGQTTGSSAVNNGKNEVFFRNTADGGVIARTYWWYNGQNQLIDADIIFYDGGWQFFTGTSGCSGGVYIEDIAAHEFGHALGLGHSADASATMYGSAQRCATTARNLAADDIAGVEKLYPPTTANTAPTVTISSPAHGATYAQGTTVQFSGSASDKEDGNLGAKINWMSSLDGYLGTGTSFTRVLTIGSHTITATVYDSKGALGARTVSVTVNATVTNAAPTVTITSPAQGAKYAQGATVQFSGSASDKEDGNLGAKLAWMSSLDGYLATGTSFTRILSAGSHTITATVYDSKGALGTGSVSVTVNATVTNTAPTVNISAPLNNASMSDNTAVTFSGTAADKEDGTLTAKLAWTSSRDGKLGTGGSFSKILSAGIHTIEATVTDSGGLKSAKSVSVTVTATTVTPTVISLSATSFYMRGTPQANLKWSGATSSQVDIYRDTVRIVTKVNDGAYVDGTYKTVGSSATYKVCEAGTSTCSNAVKVTF